MDNTKYFFRGYVRKFNQYITIEREFKSLSDIALYIVQIENDVTLELIDFESELIG